MSAVDNVAQPPSGMRTAGWAHGSKLASAHFNDLGRGGARWDRHLDLSARRGQDDREELSAPFVLAGGISFDGAGGLSPAPLTGGTYLLGPDRVDFPLDVLAAKYPEGTLTLVAGVTNYLHARADSDPSSSSSCGDLLLSTNASEPGWTALRSYSVDGGGIVAVLDDYSAFTLRERHPRRFLSDVTVDGAASFAGSVGVIGDLNVGGQLNGLSDAYVGGSLTVDGAGDFGGALSAGGNLSAGGTLGVVGAATLYSTLDVAGAQTFSAIAAWAASSATALVTLTPSGAGGALNATCGVVAATTLVNVNHGGTGTAFKATAANGKAVWAVGSSTAAAMTADAGAGQAALLATASATSNNAGSFVGGTVWSVSGAGATNGGGVLGTGAGTGSGVGALGGTSAGAYGLQSLARNSTGYAIYAQTHTTATSAIAAAWLEGRDSAAGAEMVSAASYAAILTPKLSSPTLGALLARQQYTYPTSAVDGSLAYASNVFGQQGHWVHGCAADGVFRGMWSSIGGFVYAASYAASASNANEAVYTNVTNCTASNGNAPKEAGGLVKVTVVGRARTSTAAANGLDIKVVQGASTVVEYSGSGSGSSAGWPLTGATTGWDRSFSFIYYYYLPAAGSTTFTLQHKRQTAANTVTVQASIVVEGCY